MSDLFEGQDAIILCERMGNSKEDLLNLVRYFYGEYSDEYCETNFLIQTNDDLVAWIKVFQGNIDEVEAYNRDFRRWKMKQNIDYGDFIDLMELDMLDGVETFFQQKASMRTLSELESSLGEGMQYKQLWNLHKQQPYSRIEYLISIEN